jgi:hypothetical protein
MSFELTDFAVLWSPKQNAFHIEIISDMINKNREILVNEQDGDFIVLKFTKTKADADAAMEAFARARMGANA